MGSGDVDIGETVGETDTRFNDVIFDPPGSLYDTMRWDSRSAGLYEADGVLTELFDGVGMSNGTGFTVDETGMYFIDSCAKKIFLFDYDGESGELSNRRVFAEIVNEERVPDDTTVDAKGYAWCVRWDGGCLTLYTPDGSALRRMEFPAGKVSIVAFGGAQGRELHVTSPGAHDRGANGPGAGVFYRLHPNVVGRAKYRSRICL